MTDWQRRTAARYAILLTMAITLVALAWLQYRWSAQVSEAEREQLRARLSASVRSFQSAFVRDLSRLGAAFQLAPASSNEEVKSILRERARNVSHAGMPGEFVRGVYVAQPGPEGSWRLWRLPSSSELFTETPWPPAWTALQQQFDSIAEYLQHASPRQWHYRPWLADASLPVLFRAAIAAPSEDEDEDTSAYKLLGYVLIELDREHLEKEYFPELAHRCFGGLADLRCSVSVVGGGRPASVLYHSEPEANRSEATPADAVADLLRPPEGGRGPRGAPPIRPVPDGATWQLQVQHRAGSLDAAVARLRHRNLAISFGVLLLLAAGLAFVVISAQRARELARLQVEFVAGVSHELRTPVAAVSMVADNLADDIVQTPEQLHQYGGLLRQQARRLKTMIEQTLLFAALERERPRYEVRPTSVAEAVDLALAEEKPLIEAAGITVEKRLAPDLPTVLADPAALKQCIENLLSNARKYGGEGRWIGVGAEAASRRSGEVQLTIEDRGRGIEPRERARLFQPFYRGAAAREAQIAGSGLGLSLVKQMVEGMGGRITVRSEPGEGSAFILHLPAAGVRAPSDATTSVRI